MLLPPQQGGGDADRRSVQRLPVLRDPQCLSFGDAQRPRAVHLEAGRLTRRELFLVEQHPLPLPKSLGVLVEQQNVGCKVIVGVSSLRFREIGTHQDRQSLLIPAQPAGGLQPFADFAGDFVPLAMRRRHNLRRS
jgi:hypothetical protein